MTRAKVLVVTTDPVTQAMPGPAIRAWHLSEQLAHRHEVTLHSTVACDRSHPAFNTSGPDSSGAGDPQAMISGADAVVGPSSLPRHWPCLLASEVPLAMDLYDPYHLENLEPDGRSSASEHRFRVSHLVGVIGEALERGDFFLCASERQRDFWLGSLAGAGRVNPDTYQRDPRLRSLIDVVPFGIASEPPARRGPGLKGVLAGIGAGDRLVVWGGGVYDWLDPCGAIEAIDRLKEAVPQVRLVFLGMSNPNPAIPEMRVAREARELSESLGLTGRQVFFREGWVPYDTRADYLLDADVALSTHPDHIETRFSFRTRVLDYLWAGLPMLLTAGDELAELVRSEGIGVVVEAGDPEAIASGLKQLLDSPPPAARVREVAARFSWEIAAEPLLQWCENPRPAADRDPSLGGAASGSPTSGSPAPGRRPEGVPTGAQEVMGLRQAAAGLASAASGFASAASASARHRLRTRPYRPPEH